MAANVIAALLFVALAAASAPRIVNKPYCEANCRLVKCAASFKGVEFSTDEVHQNMEVQALMHIDHTKSLEVDSYMKFVLYKRDEMIHETDDVCIDVPFSFQMQNFIMSVEGTPLPREPGPTTFAFLGTFLDWEPSYYMMNVILRDEKKDVMMDAKFILDDDNSASWTKLEYEDLTKPTIGWLVGLEMDDDMFYADTTRQLDIFIGHKNELTGKAKWKFLLFLNDRPQHAEEWTLDSNRPLEHGELYLEMNDVELPLAQEVDTITFMADFRFPRSGKWVLEAELFDEHGDSVVHLEFTADVRNPEP